MDEYIWVGDKGHVVRGNEIFDPKQGNYSLYKRFDPDEAENNVDSVYVIHYVCINKMPNQCKKIERRFEVYKGEEAAEKKYQELLLDPSVLYYDLIKEHVAFND